MNPSKVELRSGPVPPPANSPASVEEYFRDLRATIDRLPYATIRELLGELFRAYHEQRTIFIFGNGGSAATASHMICDLGKGVVRQDGAKRLRVLALTDNVPMITAWANDVDYEEVFAQQLANFVQPGDAALAISGSGNSPNVLKALQVARQAKAVTLGLTGYAGGRMKALCDVCVVIPSDNMQVIEDLHHSVAHSLFTVLRRELSRQAKAAGA